MNGVIKFKGWLSGFNLEVLDELHLKFSGLYIWNFSYISLGNNDHYYGEI